MRGINDGEVTLDKALERILPAQKDYLSASEKFAAYIGGFGSGKTVATCAAAILMGEATPGGYSLIGRLHKPALELTTRKTFLEMFPLDWVADEGRGWRESKNILTHRNGHEFIFTHLDESDPELKHHIRSLNLSAFYVDEAPEISYQTFLTLASRLRRQNVAHRIGRLSGNAAGQDWIWENFFDEKRTGQKKAIFKGILAPTTENVHLPEGYIEDLLAIYPDDWRERYLYGSFADFTDKVYKDWNSNVHLWDCAAQFDVFNGDGHPPKDWPVIVGIDIGGVDPWSIVLIAVQPETGYLYQFAEYHQAGVLVRDVLGSFWPLLGDHQLEGMAYDYENQQAALELAAEGLPGTPANKDVKAGIFKVAQYLHPDPRLVHPFTGNKPAPRFYVCGNCCPSTRRSLAAYSWGKDRAGNLTGRPKEDENEHDCDAVRYAIHTFRPEPRKLAPKPIWQNPALDPLSRQYWREVIEAEARGIRDPHERYGVRPRPRGRQRYDYRRFHV